MRILPVYKNNYPAFEQTVCEAMAQNHVPGVSLAIIERGAIAFSASYGISDSETCAPVTANTGFEAASLTKPLFAALILRLCGQGVVQLDVPIADQDPSEAPSADERYRLITPRHVLCHSCGFANWSDEHPMPMRFTPGERMSYSGEGYHYLQRAAERLTGKPLDVLGREMLLEPWGMRHSRLKWDESARASVSRSFDKDGKMDQPCRGNAANAAYSLYTTAGDYAKFLQQLMAPEHGGIPSDLFDQMIAPQISATDRVDWGLGWGIAAGSQPTVLWHWGDNGDFKAFACWCPETCDACVSFSNGWGGTPVGIAIAQALTGFDFSGIDSFISHAE